MFTHGHGTTIRVRKVKDIVPIIEVQNVYFAYHRTAPVLRSLSFNIDKGEAVVLLGENGSGKSTIFLNLLHLVLGYHGKIIVDGMLVSHKTEKKIRQKVGLVFQNSNDQLFLPTVKEELAFGPWNLGLRDDLLEARIHESAVAIGIVSLLEKKIFHLSQGEKKKVAIAAVYAMNPEIFLFDEPFANLDPKTKSDLTQILTHLHQGGKTVILISHEVDSIPPFFSRAIVLHEGRKTFDGSLRQLYQQSEILAEANLRVPIVAKLYQFVESHFNFSPNEEKIQKENTIPIDTEEFIQYITNKFKKDKKHPEAY